MQSVENEPVVYVGSKPKPQRHSRKLFVVIIVLVAGALGYLLISKLISTITNNKSNTEKVLTINDLDNPNVKLDSTTSDASVENLTKVLQAKISKQIIAKENPFETVNQLAGVLANTTNKTRQDQLTSFLEDFLAKHEDALQFKADSETPDQAQVNYWKTELYAKLAYNYQYKMLNKFSGSDGKPIDTTAEQLKYVDLYLAIAQNPANWGKPQISEVDGHTWYYHDYNQTSDFIALREQLQTGATQWKNPDYWSQ